MPNSSMVSETRLERSFRIVVVVRYSEIGIKKGNRSYFENLLIKNLRYKLDVSSINARSIDVLKYGGRIYFIFDFDSEQCFLNQKQKLEEIFKLTPGVSSFSFSRIVSKDMSAIASQALELVTDFVRSYNENEIRKIRVKIETQRIDKSFSYISPEINKYVANYIMNQISNEDNDFLKNINLELTYKKADYVIYIEISRDFALVFDKKIVAMEGLPQQNTYVLGFLSGGIDSPVAIALSMKRGLKLVVVHFLNSTQAILPENIELLVKRLSMIQPNLSLILVPFADVEQELVKYVKPRYRILILRRLFFEFTEQFLYPQLLKNWKRKELLPVVVTGDNLGQVSSQTIHNLYSINRSIHKLMILRPLVMNEKHKTVEFSRWFGFYDISTLPYDDCCSLLVSKHPATRSTEEILRLQENKFDFTLKLSEALKRSKIVLFKYGTVLRKIDFSSYCSDKH